MRKPAKILLLTLVLALLPLRSLAALVVGSCAAAQEPVAAAQSLGGAQDAQADTHCPGAIFILPAGCAPLPPRADARGIALLERSFRAFFPDKLDRPPLALAR